MKETIKQICKSLEAKNNIKILFAVENGSRAWRMASQDSDYDVRFVFARPLNEYIQINQPEEIINAYFDKKINQCKQKNALIDIVGFDVFKFAKLLSSSNPSMIEWLTTDIVYYGKQNKAFKDFAKKNFNKASLYFHYKSMCRNNYIKYLKSKDKVTYKKYLYAYRGLINAKYIVYKKSIPPIIFASALKQMKNIIPSKILRKLNQIIRLKSDGKENDIIQNIVEMDDYIEEFLDNEKESPRDKQKQELGGLNKELRKIILS